MILLLSGPVGAGKSAVARELVATAATPAAYIEGDVFWSFIAKRPAEPSRAPVFKMIMRAMLASAIAFGRDGYETILDFSMPPWYVQNALPKYGARLDELDIRYAVLRPGLEICAARSASREKGAIADYASLREFYDTFATAPEANTIADDQASAAEIARRLREGLAGGHFKIALSAVGDR